MARQKGIIKLKGTIGDVSFYKSKDGYLAREKGGVDGERIKNDPAFQRTRENGSEFGRAGKAGKMLRTALRLMLQNGSDTKVTSRLTKEMMRVIKSDDQNARGERNLSGGNLNLLDGFDFNINSKLGSTLFAQYGTTLDRASNSAGVDFEDFVPKNSIAYPTGATHMKLVAGIAEIDFVEETFKFSKDETAELPIDEQVVAGFSLAPELTVGTDDDIFFALGIEFMQEVNGSFYALRNGAFNPLTLVIVSQG